MGGWDRDSEISEYPGDVDSPYIPPVVMPGRHAPVIICIFPESRKNTRLYPVACRREWIGPWIPLVNLIRRLGCNVRGLRIRLISRWNTTPCLGKKREEMLHVTTHREIWGTRPRSLAQTPSRSSNIEGSKLQSIGWRGGVWKCPFSVRPTF